MLAGGRLANAQNERTGKTVTDDSTTVTSTPDGLRLGGTKYYCTGAYFADILAVRAVVADEQRPATENARVPTCRHPGIEIVDDWDGFGQRTTSSGTVTFTDVAIDDSALLDFRVCSANRRRTGPGRNWCMPPSTSASPVAHLGRRPRWSPSPAPGSSPDSTAPSTTLPDRAGR